MKLYRNKNQNDFLIIFITYTYPGSFPKRHVSRIILLSAVKESLRPVHVRVREVIRVSVQVEYRDKNLHANWDSKGVIELIRLGADTAYDSEQRIESQHL